MTGYPARARITSRQLLYLIVLTIVPVQELGAGGPLLREYGKDALWSLVAGATAATVPLLISVHIVRRLAPLDLGATLRSRGLAGRLLLAFFGLALAVPLFNIWSAYVQTLTVEILPHTPGWAIAALGAAAVLYGARGGIEVVARAGELFAPIAIAAMGVLAAMTIPWLHVSYILPIWPQTAAALTTGGYHAFTFFSEVGFAAYLGTLVRDPSTVPRALWWALSLSFAELLMAIGMPLLMFTPEHVALLTVPLLSAVRAIHYGFLIERIDTAVVAAYSVLVALKLTLWTVLSSRLLADATSQRAYRSLTVVATAAAAGSSLVLVHNLAQVQANLQTLWFNGFAPVYLGALLLIAILLRASRARTAHA